jgi:hypothetical protein
VKRVAIASLLVLLGAGAAAAQSASSRAWQQRLELEIPLAVPIVELESVNPFAIAVDEPPSLLQSASPRKVDVRGIATVAAYVDAKGECLGGVPLELPFPGLTTPMVQGLTGSRFDPAVAGGAARASWVILEITMDGRVKEAEVLEEAFENPDPSSPPVPGVPVAMAPPGNLRKLGFTPQSQLTTLAAPRRVRIKAPGREDEIHLRALVHITEAGRCDRYVPLELYDGLNPWLSGYLASWRLEPATRDGAAHESWVVYSARVRLDLGGLDSSTVRVLRDREYRPDGQ